MSIPIAARRYIAELGLSEREWNGMKSSINCEEALIICKKGKAYGIYHGFMWKEGWMFCNFHANQFQPIADAVCWSEIKA